MKKTIITTVLAALSVSTAMAASIANFTNETEQQNPYAQSNAQVQSQAVALEQVNYGKVYKSVMIDYGESLDDLTASNYDSMHYNDTSDFKKEVTSINHLVAEDVHPGQYIVIPYYKSIK